MKTIVLKLSLPYSSSLKQAESEYDYIDSFQAELLEHQTNTLSISTVVKFHNWFGRIYFSLIKPFHKLIVKSMLNRMIKGI